VLSIWTERRSPAQMCREMQISPALLGQWQNQAMEAMITALGPKTTEPLAPLSSRLSRLMEKKLSDPHGRLEKRLKTIQKGKMASAT
jgi:transposase-like protein